MASAPALAPSFRSQIPPAPPSAATVDTFAISIRFALLPIASLARISTDPDVLSSVWVSLAVLVVIEPVLAINWIVPEPELIVALSPAPGSSGLIAIEPVERRSMVPVVPVVISRARVSVPSPIAIWTCPPFCRVIPLRAVVPTPNRFALFVTPLTVPTVRSPALRRLKLRPLAARLAATSPIALAVFSSTTCPLGTSARRRVTLIAEFVPTGTSPTSSAIACCNKCPFTPFTRRTT